MIDEDDLIELINNSEWLLEGLDKDFWRMIKLTIPELWENPEDYECEYLWVVAVMGNRCICYNDEAQGFNIATYELWGDIEEHYSNVAKLHDLVSDIIRSRYKFYQ